ncbi:hypothetical protein RSOL_230890 [Rhizoctonia solani AG-3 Rhs1AP]|uniref:Uncharacterized protein n=2 Tax=Rhizoctonia solani AG-3 TaxID=1086053 RepID=A0A074RZF1_9AGAM|nr:hypothetical protein RSOL_230890 [Rhizoctonia solani AG-3 Rhs1AP]KEP52389.1 hypothetical protein V565_046000 [Rhizoctonia solani 123E]
MSQLPPHLLVLFNVHPKASPRARASVPAIRNRGCAYVSTESKLFDPDVLSNFKTEIRCLFERLVELLVDLEGERSRERKRAARSQVLVARAREEETLQEEEESIDEESDPAGPERLQPDPAEKDIRETIRERFIGGILAVRTHNVEYDTVDWNEWWDPDGQDNEERWFNGEEEGWIHGRSYIIVCEFARLVYERCTRAL